MNIYEFRIGNFVQFETTEKIDATIIGFDGKHILYHPRFQKVDYTQKPFKALPIYLKEIPINEELLTRFDFEKSDRNETLFVKNMGEYNLQVLINGFSGTLEKPPLWFFTIKGYNDYITIQRLYIHELQNYYYEFTLKELTLN